MMTTSQRFGTLALPGILLLLAGPALANPMLWTVGGAEKIRPSAAPGTQTEALLSGARNEFVEFQIAVEGPASAVSASTGSLSDGAGDLIPAGNIRLYREGLIDVTTPSNVEGAVGQWPDPLIPAVDEFDGQARNAFPFDIPTGEARAIWVDIQIPATSPAGTYQGAVTVSGGGFSTRVPVQLVVWDFSLPSTPTLQTAYLLFAPNVLMAHGLGGWSGWTTQAGLDLVDRYVRFALDHRISLTNAFLPPNYGGALDFATFTQRYGAWFAGTAATRLPGAELTTADYPMAVDSALYAAWASYAKSQSFFSKTFDYTADEPGYGSSWSSIPPRAAAVKAGDPAFPVLVTTTLEEATANGMQGVIDWMVPCITSIGTATPAQETAQYASFLAQPGTKVWLYQSCASHGCSGPGNDTGWPQMTIDSSALRTRAMQWLDFEYGASGELYYETAMAFSGAPWTDQYYFGGNGDGTLFYPGTPAEIGGQSQVPVASLRLKQIRDGVQDYEYLSILSGLGDRAFALAQAATVAPAGNLLGSDPSALYQARQLIAQRIVSLLHPAPPTSPPPTAGTTPATGSGTTGSGQGASTGSQGSLASGSRAAPPSPGPGARASGGLAVDRGEVHLGGLAFDPGDVTDLSLADRTPWPTETPSPPAGPVATAARRVVGRGCATGAGSGNPAMLSLLLVGLGMASSGLRRRRQRTAR
ncbi:MAG: DUF4091 domain-containing protein [Deltaproteobacteria bacterium]